ncbi:39S ribosomal protein L3, mitochondrial [Sitodiplosis mosellana]|uniref:39S ribosomal protein L3, mitochondrial n=1 Tax=Sitodiplosis mosellana TaxID=263140 RepID=UPI0024450797|nr:39S ribosomal protein L3, mitochondrial [Sitodiplosis mosellana]
MLRSMVTTLFQSRLSPITVTQVRECRNKILPKPRKRNPVWFVRQKRTIHEDFVTEENKKFVTEVLNDRFGVPTLIKGAQTYPKNLGNLIDVQQEEKQEDWNRFQRRSGLIARKIGVVPVWRKDGTKMTTTMLQIEDNHVIKYFSPEEYTPAHQPRVKNLRKFGCVLVGAGSADPSLFTKEYCGLFRESGVLPKRHLGRFLVTPNAKLLPGTPLNVTHFRVGDFVDIRGKTVDRGFQGVMKRWGFKGMPATHGVTKTHRRPGNIGSGGAKARVWPGQKMPGHMGNRHRKLKGLQIVRINKEYNVMWVTGQNVPGEHNNFVYIYDTILPLKRNIIQPPFPTRFDDDGGEVDVFADGFHDFRNPTIFYEDD